MGIAIANRKNRCDFGALSIGPYEFQGKFVWTNGPFAFFSGKFVWTDGAESLSKVSPKTGLGPWMALPSCWENEHEVFCTKFLRTPRGPAHPGTFTGHPRFLPSKPYLASAVVGPFWRQDRKILSPHGSRPNRKTRSLGVKDRLAKLLQSHYVWASGALSNHTYVP